MYLSYLIEKVLNFPTYNGIPDKWKVRQVIYEMKQFGFVEASDTEKKIFDFYSKRNGKNQVRLFARLFRMPLNTTLLEEFTLKRSHSSPKKDFLSVAVELLKIEFDRLGVAIEGNEVQETIKAALSLRKNNYESGDFILAAKTALKSRGDLPLEMERVYQEEERKIQQSDRSMWGRPELRVDFDFHYSKHSSYLKIQELEFLKSISTEADREPTFFSINSEHTTSANQAIVSLAGAVSKYNEYSLMGTMSDEVRTSVSEKIKTAAESLIAQHNQLMHLTIGENSTIKNRVRKSWYE